MPDCAPITVGLNVTLAVQLAPAARLEEQVVESEYPVVGVTELRVIVVLPVLESVTVCADELEPTVTLPNDSEEVLRDSEVCKPVPDKDTALFPALVLKVSVPDCVPFVVGVNVTFVEQLPPAESEVEQLVDTEYCPEPVTDVMLTVVFPVLVSVTACAEELEPTFTLPKAREPTLVVSAVWRPVPDRLATSLPAPVAKVTVPLCAPMEVGTKVTLAVQVAPAARVLPQVVETEYWPVPVTDETLRVVLPVLESVTDCDEELDPTFTLPNASAVVLTEAEVCSPVPDNDTALLPALVLKVSVPLCAPFEVGEKTTLAVQLPPAARLLAQFVETEYCPEPVTDVRVIVVLPVLESVTDCTAELEPTVILPNASVPTFVVSVVCSPVPVRETVSLPALVANVSVPVCVPIAVGVYTTFAVQLPPTARLEGQVFVSE